MYCSPAESLTKMGSRSMYRPAEAADNVHAEDFPVWLLAIAKGPFFTDLPLAAVCGVAAISAAFASCSICLLAFFSALRWRLRSSSRGVSSTAATAGDCVCLDGVDAAGFFSCVLAFAEEGVSCFSFFCSFLLRLGCSLGVLSLCFFASFFADLWPAC